MAELEQLPRRADRHPHHRRESRARAASRAASASVSRKTASSKLTLPGKLSDCTAKKREDTELFIVEGDSAGGSAKQGRKHAFQAILPLRGKVLNVERAGLKKVLDNKELSDLTTALGCGIGPNFDLAKLRYQRIILLADADSDGHHITTLLLTFFFRHMPQLISAGRLYIAVPPLYRVDIGKETFWAADEADRVRILEENGGGRSTPQITRFKGLGEMMPKTLWDTTLNPDTRRLLRVDITDGLLTDRVMSDLMGKDPSARFRFIMDRAEEAEASTSDRPAGRPAAAREPHLGPRRDAAKPSTSSTQRFAPTGRSRRRRTGDGARCTRRPARARGSCRAPPRA